MLLFKGMIDDSDIKNSKMSNFHYQWSLLLESFIENPTHSDFRIEKEKNHILAMLKKNGVNLSDLTKQTFLLSQQRNQIYLAIEDIKNKIDQLYSKIESMNLVKSDTETVESEIETMNKQGQNLSKKLEIIEKEIRNLRVAENSFDKV